MIKLPTPNEITVVGNKSAEKRPMLRYLGLATAFVAATSSVGCAVDAAPSRAFAEGDTTITCRTASGDVYLEDKAKGTVYHLESGVYSYTSKINNEELFVPTAQCVVRKRSTP